MCSRLDGGAKTAEFAVVKIVNVEVAELAPPVTGLGENEQLDNDGNPLQLKVTDGMTSIRALTVRVAVADPPAETVAVPEEIEIEKSGKGPLPDKDTVCGFPTALSLIISVPIRVLVAVGVNVMLKAQLADGARAAGRVPQVFVWAKSPLFVPTIVIPVMVKGPSPLFVSVTCWEGLVVLIGCVVKDRLAWDIAKPGPGMGAIFNTNASLKPRKDSCSGFTVGKLVEWVLPVT
jgi:hypothetical protein